MLPAGSDDIHWNYTSQDVIQDYDKTSSASESSMNGINSHSLSLKHHLSTPSKTDWTSTGHIWVTTADMATQPINLKYKYKRLQTSHFTHSLSIVTSPKTTILWIRYFENKYWFTLQLAQVVHQAWNDQLSASGGHLSRSHEDKDWFRDLASSRLLVCLFPIMDNYNILLTLFTV